MADYRSPGWRRIIFVAALLVILVVTFGPAISQGTVNVSIYGPPSDGVFSHIFVKITKVELHTASFPAASGWITLTQIVPKVDIVSSPGQFIPEAILSSQIQSGRYDSIRLSVSNATAMVGNTQTIPVSNNLILTSNVVVPVPPNGAGDVLVVLTVNYSQLLDSTPSLDMQILQATSS